MGSDAVFVQSFWQVKSHADNLTPLMLAVQHRNMDLVQLLLDHGADTETPGPDGVTAV